MLISNNIIGVINEHATITVQMAKIKLLSRTNLRHLDGITHHQNITECEMPNLYTARTMVIKDFPQTLTLAALWFWTTIADLVFFCLKNKKTGFTSGLTGLGTRSDRSHEPVGPICPESTLWHQQTSAFDMKLTFSNHIARCLMCQNVSSVIDMSRYMINDEFSKVKYHI